MTREAVDHEELAGIYDELIDAYGSEWSRGGHRGLHLEYYDEDHEEPGEAAINTMRVLANAAGIDESDRVLNIGCGAGEDSVWNARAHGATVVGVNISESQLELARENAREHGVEDLTTFRYDDFHELETIADGSIDVVWGLEALSHSPDRSTVLEQVRRVLAPGGRVAFTDLFVATGEISRTEREQIGTINDGLGLRLGSIKGFERTLEQAGFTGITIRDMTDGIVPCTKRRHRFARVANPAGRVLGKFDVFSETQLDAFEASSAIHELVTGGTLGYFLITATVEPEQ
jgi:SAM-dependent methyltransferase